MRAGRQFVFIASLLATAAFATSPALARTVANTKDGRPNIVVVMTDDEALTDMVAMPNTASLIANQGATFDNAVDSFPLCCPSRATFITGQYAHNHGVDGNFWPFGWYGMRDRGNTLPAWLRKSGYYTALVGKWLNGYGAGNQPGTKNPGDPADVDVNGTTLKPNGEIPAGFDNWNGAVDVSAYDYFNFGINRNGKMKYWGDQAYAKKLNTFAEIQVSTGAKSITKVIQFSNKVFGGFSAPDPSTYGSQLAANYSPDVTAELSNQIIKDQAKSKKPFFLWWSPASPHREDVNGGIRNAYRDGARYRAQAGNAKAEDKSKLIPDPRPAPRYAGKSWDWTRISGKPSYNAAPTGKPSLQQQLLGNPLESIQQRSGITKESQLRNNYNGRLGAVAAVDDGIKKLFATLKATGQLNNTLVLFTSDNGWLQGEHRVPGDKYLPYEESIRVPLLMRGPGIPAGRKITTLVSNVDFAETLLQAAKATAGRTVDGVSLLGLAKGTSVPASRAILLEANAPLFADASMPQQWDQPYKGVRTDDWKYVEWGNGDKELYYLGEDRPGLNKDTFEMNNLAGTGRPEEATLAAMLADLVHCSGAACQVAQQG